MAAFQALEWISGSRQSRGDSSPGPPYRWIAEKYNVVQRTEMPRGGHFAALEQPDLFLRDVRMFFAKIRPKATRPLH
jgi:pimeloyl-ACP methyl ester carboxylesterase